MVRAAIAVMRPSCPPPRMASSPPGRTIACHLRRWSVPEAHSAAPDPVSDRALPGCAPRATRPAARRERRRWWREFPPPAARRWPRPALPIASVPTGTPFGICTIESSESRPFNCVAATGTPSTGTSVFAASMPGRCAAPPAPAIITRSPRSSRRFSVFEEPVRRAMRAHYPRFMRNFKRAQNLHCRRKHLVVALAAHHHAHQRLLRSCADYTRQHAYRGDSRPQCSSGTVSAGARPPRPLRSPRTAR